MADVILIGTEFEVRYTEPTLDADGSSLDDLVATRIYYQLQGEPTPVLYKEVPASNPAGGGQVVERVLIPVAEGQEVNVDIWFTAIDEVPNESARSVVFVRQLDRLAPAPPQ